MSGRLSGKNVIITGAAGGIGLETAILMHREGASVLMTDVSGPALSAAYAKAVSLSSPSASGRLETLVVDVSSEASVAAAVDHISAWGGVDVMFNNAGIMHPADGDAFECPDDVWERTMAVNVKGVWYGSKHAVRGFREQGKARGSVINTASVVALVGSATPQLATPMLQDFLGDDKEKRFRREVHFPTGRFGEAVEQAHAVVFLASDESSFVNATDFVVDGGLTKAYVTPEGQPTVAPRNMAA
ncbi:Short-chain dehydrogenase reductase 2a [Lasiodiplodia hormozganensis]|uniref:Short-chain dehydrogenase reductase 2a n=1 Tax=Lasiodiplodia hormozganensis TaxID=869390 RepID=A0AA39YFD2_9PEZI|nr:Short-chain dehydrogenase reductase 2a [Lasiodiplodia hormozganensis]